MGLFDIVNKVSGVFNGDTEENKKNQIELLTNDSNIVNSEYAKLLLSRAEENDELTWGTYLIKDEAKVKNLLAIPAEEVIIVSLRTQDNLTSAFSQSFQIVFTNKAIYVNKIGRFNYDEINNYDVLFDFTGTTIELCEINTDNHVTIATRNPKISKFEKSYIGICILLGLIKNYKYHNPESTDCESKIDKLILNADEEIENGFLSNETVKSIRGCIYTAEYRKKELFAVYLQNAIKSGIKNNIIPALYDISNNIFVDNWNDAEYVNEAIDFVVEQMKKASCNISLSSIENSEKQNSKFFAEDARCKEYKKKSKVAHAVMAYDSSCDKVHKAFQLRKKITTSFNEIIDNGFYTNEENSKLFSSLKLDKNYLIGFYYEIKNRYLLNLIDSEKIDGKLDVNVFSSFNLNIIHWLLLNKKTDDIVELMDKELYKQLLADVNDEPYNVTKYSFVAAMANNSKNIVRIFLEFEGYLDVPLKTKKSFERKISLCEMGISAYEKKIDALKRSIYLREQQDDDFDASDIYDNIEKTEDFIYDLKEEINEWKNEIKDIEVEIDFMVADYIDEVTCFVEEEFCDSDNKILYFYHKIYSDKDSFRRALLSSYTDCIKYDYYGHNYYIPNFIFVDDEDTSSDDKREDRNDANDSNEKSSSNNNREYKTKSARNTTNVCRLYGNTWFSADAHKDIKILGKEYHKLVSKYHPDNQTTGDINVFLDIQKERGEILEKLVN